MALSTPVEGGLILNGGFEGVGDYPGFVGQDTATTNLNTLFANNWSVFQTIPHWTTVDGSGIEIQKDTIIKAKSGVSYVEMDADRSARSLQGQGTNSRMMQTVSLAPGDYVLRFYYHPREDGDNTNGVLIRVSGLTQLSADGKSSDPDFAGGAWRRYDSPFSVANAGDYDVTVEAFGRADGLGGFLDDIDIQPAAVPEPSAFLPVAGALMMLLARRRTNKARH